MRRAVFVLGLPGLVLFSVSCSEKEAGTRTNEAAFEVPTFYDSVRVAQYAALGDSGYALLDEGKTDEAVALFTRQMELIPEGKSGAYNVACAYGRSGRVNEGIAWLTRAVDGGWDSPEQLESDPDLDTLRSDKRFATLKDHAAQTHATRTAPFAHGLPQPAGPAVSFSDLNSLEQWSNEERSRIRAHYRVWHDWQNAAATLNHAAKRLAALRPLKAEDPEFDYGLERIRAISQVFSPYESWGALSDGVQKEVDDYLAGTPSEAGRSAAHYRAAVAAYMKRIPRASTDPDWAEVAKAMRAHLAEVQPRTVYEGAAVAARLMLDIEEAGDGRDALLPRVREFVETFRDDRTAMGLASRFFQKECLLAMWPIPLDAVDIDGRPVSLDQYKGKVLLIDFWATWCAPCRAELPHLVDAHERFASKGFEILSISLDRPDDKTTEDYRAWTSEKGMRWRHVYDQKSWESPLVRAFLVQAIPAPILVGPDGAIVAMDEDCSGERLAESIQRALGITPA